jgi:hypothetical protein
MVWVYPKDLAETEEIQKDVMTKVRRLRSATLGQIVASGRGVSDPLASERRTGWSEVDDRISLVVDGDDLLRRIARAVIVARMYDLLHESAAPLIRESYAD